MHPLTFFLFLALTPENTAFCVPSVIVWYSAFSVTLLSLSIFCLSTTFPLQKFLPNSHPTTHFPLWVSLASVRSRHHIPVLPPSSALFPAESLCTDEPWTTLAARKKKKKPSNVPDWHLTWWLAATAAAAAAAVAVVVVSYSCLWRRKERAGAVERFLVLFPFLQWRGAGDEASPTDVRRLSPPVSLLPLFSLPLSFVYLSCATFSPLVHLFALCHSHTSGKK